MGIMPMFDKGAILNPVAAFQKQLELAFVTLLKYMGEKLAKYAKDSHNYQDQTGNLTNSIGYAVVQNKEIVYYGGSDQPGEGAKAMLEAAMKYAATLPNTFSLIIVAGMNYAAYVEAKGYNVILPAELKAKSELPAEIKKLVMKANKKAIELFGNAA